MKMLCINRDRWAMHVASGICTVILLRNYSAANSNCEEIVPFVTNVINLKKRTCWFLKKLFIVKISNTYNNKENMYNKLLWTHYPASRIVNSRPVIFQLYLQPLSLCSVLFWSNYQTSNDFIHNLVSVIDFINNKKQL